MRLSDAVIPFHIGRPDGETVPQQITAAWREASPAAPPQKTTTPKAVEPWQCPFDLFKVVSSFRSISAGGAFCTTQRLAFVGRLRRPFAYVRANPRLKILHSSLFILHFFRVRRPRLRGGSLRPGRRLLLRPHRRNPGRRRTRSRCPRVCRPRCANNIPPCRSGRRQRR